MPTRSPMTRLISKMRELAQTGAHGQMIDLARSASEEFGTCWLRSNRIAFRSAWAMRSGWSPTPPTLAALRWELEYDDNNNFARMGAEYVDDDWGKPQTKAKSRRRPNSPREREGDR